MSNRRTFLQQSASLSALSLLPWSLWADPKLKPKFKLSLQAGNIGVKASQTELLDMAVKHGYELIAPYPGSLAEMTDEEREDFLDKMKEAGIGWGSAGLPVDFRKDEALYREGIKQLPRLAGALAAAEGTRMNTWIMPTHATRTLSS